MAKTVKDIATTIDQQALLGRPVTDWLPILADECQVYQLDNGGYIGKSFSQIHYRFCDAKTATEMLIDNLHSILRNKYFTVLTDEVFDRISQIVTRMTSNLRSTLKTITFKRDNLEDNPDLQYARFIPDGCIAFRNGVYDFRNAKWLFKYDKIQLSTGLTLISYTKEYMVRWYFNYNFEPLDFSLADIELKDFVQVLRELNDVQRNYCFELVYNMSFTNEHKFSLDRFEHICQILGYTCLNSFAQNFVMLIGAGQNGKNSLFDGFFTSNCVPKPSSLSLDEIETDTFITGALEGVAHNIFLETSAKTYRESRVIKSLTGSEDQTIHHKGVGKYSGILNCKFVFAGNDRNEIKFADTTNGFLRRINMFEIFYTWDSKKQFLKSGDYYDASFSSDLRELKDDKASAIVFAYLAMYGIKSATKNFKSVFTFTHNEWNADFADVDHDLKMNLEKIRISELFAWGRESKTNADALESALYAKNKVKLWKTIYDENENQAFSKFEQLLNHSKKVTINESGTTDEIFDGDDFVKDFDDVFISTQFLKEYLKDLGHARAFTLALQRLYGTNCFNKMGANVTVIHCNFKKDKLHIIR